MRTSRIRFRHQVDEIEHDEAGGDELPMLVKALDSYEP